MSSVIYIGTEAAHNDSRGFSGFCFWVFADTSTKSSRPDPAHQSPASCPRMYVPPACLYCPLLAPPHPPRAAAHAPASEYHFVHHFASAVPNRAANPTSFMQAARPGATRPFDFYMRPSSRLPLIRRDSQRTCASSWLLVVDIPRQQPERKWYMRTTTNPSGNAEARA